MEQLHFGTYLTTNLEVGPDDLEALRKLCTIEKVQKNDFLLRKGQHCAHTFFVETGLLRQFSLDSGGKEHILAFAPEGWFMSDRDSLFFDRPSQYNIQALEDSRVAMLSRDFMQQLDAKIPGFTDFNNRLLHNHIRHLQERIALLLGAPAEERYRHFVARYPDLQLRVPQRMIAAYLGITPESLSRVRRSLARKHGPA